MYLTRDQDNTLSLHKEFPNRITVAGYVAYWSNDMITMDENKYPEVLHEDGPVEVELNIVPLKGII